jgi:predicted metal-dependent hydrolase
LDLELEFLYRERLEVIDAQIAKCREAVAANPANAHIRRYLMAALQDKKETLAEVLNLKSEKSKSRRST